MKPPFYLSARLEAALTIEDELRAALSYNPITGHFTWRYQVSYKCKAGTRAGCNQREGYRTIGFRRKIFREHKLAWFFVHGEWPPAGYVVDHINRDGFDNRIENLRLATVSENLRNTGAQRNNSLGIKGVRLSCGLYSAEITVNYVKHYLGRFETPQKAAAAYAAAAARLHGDFACHSGRSHRSRHGL